jgi:hypothetical protein
LHGEEGAGSDILGHVDEGGVVSEPERIFGVHDERPFAAGTEFVAGIVEEKKGTSLVGVAVIGIDSDSEELNGDDAAVGRPREGLDEIGEGLIAEGEFFSGEEAAALAVGFEEEDVVALVVVLFGFVHAADGEGDAAVGGVGEGGDFLVNVDEGLIEVLGGGGERGEEEEEGGEEEKEAGEESQFGQNPGTEGFLTPAKRTGRTNRAPQTPFGMTGSSLRRKRGERR